ncbi:MAG: SDR family oxidoreductase [Pseudomonadota bacterium]|nr:SDR family oxidoreductase [Pseudomonadota bacterium]
MDLGLTGKVALVLGASQGLGLAIAGALAAEGAAVGLVSRNAEKLAAAAADIRGRSEGKAMFAAADVGSWPDIERAHGAIAAAFGPPDILVNNSGGPPPVDVTIVDAALWQAQFEAMVLNQMRLTELVLPPMRRKKFGRILSVSSTSIIAPIPSLAISNALRSALAQWMKTLAGEVARDGVTVNLLLPGSMATARTEGFDRAAAAKRGVAAATVAAEAAAEIPAGRYGDPKEFGDAAAFLASPRASYITGVALRVDGGVTHSL